MDAGPLKSAAARLLWLRAVCAVAEGADVPLSHTTRRAPSSSSRCQPDVCVAAVLGDAEHRVAVLGGREGMPRSLGSIYSGSVTRFLGDSFRGVVSRVIHVRGAAFCNGIAVSPDGGTLMVSDSVERGSLGVYDLSVSRGVLHRLVGGSGDGRLQFNFPEQLYIPPDGFVFVADSGNNRVQVLTPSLNFHCFIGRGELGCPVGVCAGADVVAVSEQAAARISVFDRGSGALLRRIACGHLSGPGGLCFMSGDRHVAVADRFNHRVSVFSVDGEFIRHVGVGVLSGPMGVAASACDELVVADHGNRCLRVFSDTGDLLASVGTGWFSGVAVHGGCVFAKDESADTVSVFK
jgi:DNA-binding beta-propeller fold protein YncE